MANKTIHNLVEKTNFDANDKLVIYDKGNELTVKGNINNLLYANIPDLNTKANNLIDGIN